jgi:diacylglycerol kinase family enzyme
MPTKYAVLVNLAANNGRAARRWESIAAEVVLRLPLDTQVISFRPPTDIKPKLNGLLQAGIQGFVSAGGDGSANILLNQLMRQTGENARQLTLGGIGLGSSNDFIKPKQHFLKGLPTRLEVQNASLVDVGKAEFRDGNGDWQTQYFIANASLGVTAEANWFFNHGDWFLRVTKDRWTDLAIVYAALRTIIRFENFHATLTFEQEKLETKLSNLAILKSPYVSGSFHFDDPVQRDDGFLGLNVCLDMKKTELLGVLAGLAKGRFRGRPKTFSIAKKDLSVQTQTPVALEMDGEIYQTTEVRFPVIPKAIRLMGL